MNKTTLTPISASTIEVNNQGIPLVEKTFNSEIIELITPDGQIISTGNEIDIEIEEGKRTVYKVKEIGKGQKGYYLFSSIPTRSYQFLLPLLGHTKKDLKSASPYMENSTLVGSMLENVYLYSDYKDPGFRCLHLLYRFTPTDSFKTAEASISKLKGCFGKYETDPFHVVYMFGIPENLYKDIDLFNEGKYSQFSKASKQKIIDYHRNGPRSKYEKVLNPDKKDIQKLANTLGIDCNFITELASKPDNSEILRKQIYDKSKRIKI